MIGEICFFALYDITIDFQGASVECKLNGGQLAFIDSLERLGKSKNTLEPKL